MVDIVQCQLDLLIVAHRGHSDEQSKDANVDDPDGIEHQDERERELKGARNSHYICYPSFRNSHDETYLGRIRLYGGVSFKLADRVAGCFDAFVDRSCSVPTRLESDAFEVISSEHSPDKQLEQTQRLT